jgi:hypothetical protein
MLRSTSYRIRCGLLMLCVLGATACSSDDTQRSTNGTGGVGANSGVGGASVAGASTGGSISAGGSTSSGGTDSVVNGGQGGENTAGSAGEASGGTGGVGINANDTTNHSGSRLKWRPFEASAGVGFGGEWFDSKLNEVCSFEPGPDGKLRCLPSATTVLEKYADPECRNLAVSFSSAQCTKRFAQRTTSMECSTKREIFPLGAEIKGDNLYTGSSCKVEPLARGAQAFPVGAAMAASEFVEADVTTLTTATRLQPRFLVGSDGSSQFLGWYDTERKENCRFTIAIDDRWRCLPEATIPLVDRFVEYSDTACNTRAVAASDCDLKKYLTIKSACTGTRILGNTGKVSILSVNDPFIGCQKITPGQPGLGVGPEIAPTEFAEGGISIESGPQRIRKKIATTADGTKQVVGLYDSELKTDCDFRIAQDGERRCMPSRSQDVLTFPTFFTDAECTQPIRAKSPCAAAFAESINTSSCPAKSQSFRVTESFHNGPIYQKEGLNCLYIDLPPNATVQLTPISAASLTSALKE